MTLHLVGVLRTLLLISCAQAMLLMQSRPADAAQPIRFNYQAKLTDSAANPLQGPQTLLISLWSGGTEGVADSGTQLYGESTVVTAANGVVNHVIGTGTNTFGGPLTDSMFATSAEIFVQVAVGLPSNVVLPRERLESVPFAVSARSADSAVNGVAAGYMIMGTTPVAPPGFTAVGKTLQNSWQLRASLLIPRFQFGMASANDKFYAIGGLGESSITSPANEEYSPETNSWTEKASLAVARGALTCDGLGGMVYAVGGITTATSLAITTNEVFNPGTNSWDIRQPMGTARAAHASAVANGKLYVFGGVGENAATTVLNSVEEYNPNTNLWTPKANMPTARYYPNAATVDGIIYVIGGAISFNSPNTLVNEAFDPVGNTWTTKAPMPVEILAGSVVAYEGKVYMIGGQNASDQQISDTWVYDPVANSWSLGTSMSAPRVLHRLAVANDRIYAVGGTENISDPLGRNEMLDPTTYFLFTKD